MPGKQVPRSHGSFGNDQEFGEEFYPENVERKETIQITKKGFRSKLKKKKDKSEEVARQNLE
jgi:hypothetical protein